MAKKGVRLIPSARRLVRSLRDMGYDFSQAVADIIDNSIEANADCVSIKIEFDGDDSTVRIFDNGSGMTPSGLREAMRYGSDRKYSDVDLGKFGLGLKTASMSQCQLLIVASRHSARRADIDAYSWDLEHIENTNRWEIVQIKSKDLAPEVNQHLGSTTGTVIIWKKLDRILGYKHPYGEFAKKRLSQLCRELEFHLGMVFHRFLSGEVPDKSLKILLNGNEVNPWDPFCRTEQHTKQLQSFSIPIEHNGTIGTVMFEPHILPHQEDFSSQQAFRNAGGPNSWNQQQGFYIYRSGRMIQSGGWSRLTASDEHMKLARIAVSFLPALDEAFKINVAKMRVQLPTQIRDDVRKGIAPIRKMARSIYDRKPNRSNTTIPSSTSFAVGTKPIGVNESATSSENANTRENNENVLVFTLEEWGRKLLELCTRKEKRVLKTVIEKLRAKVED